MIQILLTKLCNPLRNSLPIIMLTGIANPAFALEQCNDKGPPILVAEQVCAFWKRQDEDVRGTSQCCLPLQKKAKRKQTQALKHNEQAHNLKLTTEQRKQHLDEANRLFKERGVFAKKFTDCVNQITHALNVEKQTGTNPHDQLVAACGGDFNFIQNLGWRRCVDLNASTLAVDHNLLSAQNSYNCHFYVKSFLKTAQGLAVRSPNLLAWNSCINASKLPGYSVTPVNQVHRGDIVLVKGQHAFPCRFHHSGVVIAVDKKGRPKRIRQKDGPDTCVVDLDLSEFKQVWLNRKGVKAVFYSNPEYAGALPRWKK